MKQKSETPLETLHEREQLEKKKIRTEAYLPPVHIIVTNEDDEASLVTKKSRTDAYQGTLLSAQFDLPETLPYVIEEPQEQRVRPSSFCNNSDLRFIPHRDKYFRVKFDIDTKNVTPYEDLLSNGLWGINLSENTTRPLFGKTKKPQPPVYNQPVSTTPPESIKIRKRYKNNHLIDDFYASPMAWSENGCVYMGLGDVLCFYKPRAQLWKPLTKHTNQPFRTIHAICATFTNVVYSRGEYQSQGGTLCMMDTSTGKASALQKIQLNVIRGHQSNPHLFYAGGFYGHLGSVDIRMPSPVTLLETIQGRHRLCGMDVNGDMIATGDNGNRVFIWDIKNLKTPVLSYEHQAAVKALAFSPFNKSLLASGGGTNDRTIQIWNINKQEKMYALETEGQIANLHWIDKNRVLITGGLMGGKEHPAQILKIEKAGLKCVGALPREVGRMLFSTQNPDNPYQFFTGTDKHCLRWLEVEHEEEKSIFSQHINGIR